MTSVINQVRRFYSEIWNERNMTLLPEVLHENFSFRGSLGDEATGHAAFAAYMHKVHAVLGDYHCDIEELVAEENKVFAKMLFSGIHRGELLGYPPSGRRVSWAGAALFQFHEEKISSLWVLGDLQFLKQQLHS